MRAAEFDCGERPSDGGPGWVLPGIPGLFAKNPALYVHATSRELVSLWGACLSGMGGIGHFPSGGGPLFESNWLMEAFETMNAQLAVLREDDNERRKRERGS